MPTSSGAPRARSTPELPRVTSDELSHLLSQPRTPRVLIHLLRSCGLTQGHIASALGVPASSVGNWASGKADPGDALYERLDVLRTIASYVLANRLEGDDERIVKAFLLGKPQGVVDENGDPCTPMAALAARRDQVVIDAARAFGSASRYSPKRGAAQDTATS